MKKKIALLLIAMMTIGTLAGCGDKSSSDDAGTDGSEGTVGTEDTEGTTEGTDSTESTETLADLDTTAYMTLGQYKGISVDVAPAEVTDADVEDYITNTLIAEYGTDVDLGAEDVIQSGDTVVYSCVGTVDGVVFDGGSSEEGSDWTTTIGSGGTIPGFEDGFIGMAVGENKDIIATFPTDYQEVTLQGKEAVFNVTVTSATRREGADSLTPEVLAFYEYDSEDACRADVRATLEEEAQTAYDADFETAVLTAISEGCIFTDTPQFLIDTFVASQNEYYEYYASAFGMEFEPFVNQYCGVTLDEYNAQILEIATSYAQQYLMYEAIADAEGINVVGDELDTYAEATAADYGYESIDALYEDFGYNDFRDYTVIQLVIDFVIENAVNTHTDDAAVTE